MTGAGAGAGGGAARHGGAARRDRADFGGLLARLRRHIAGPEGWEALADSLPPPVQRRLVEEFFWQAHGGQRVPAGGWRVWLLMAGRGFGKTLAGAQWVTARARSCPGARIALVGRSYDEVAKVMIEGNSGLLAAARTGEEPLWLRSQREVRFRSGACAFVYSAEAAEKLRGPEHHFAWCDEVGKWPNADSAWDNLQMGLRLGRRPRLVATTTPRAVALLRRVRTLSGLVETNGRTADNVHLPAAFTDWALETYGGTRLGRQELDGFLFEEAEGALWTRATIEAARAAAPAAGDPFWRRVAVGVDPPASATGNACGIVVCGLGEDGRAYVLADRTVAGQRPDGWARAVAAAAAAWNAQIVIAEKNQGGDMVGSVLASVEAALPVRLVSARGSKAARAEPVAAMFENGRARLAGRFPELEDEMAALTAGGGFEGAGSASPDRADAMVWAMAELLRPRREPRVIQL